MCSSCSEGRTDHAGLHRAGSYYNGNNLPYSTPGAYYTPQSSCNSGCMNPISTASYSFQAVSGGEPKSHAG